MSDAPTSSSQPVDPVDSVDDALFQAALARIDEANALDPNLITIDGETLPYELFYSRRLTAWVQQLQPAASQPLLLAARAQHIGRWQIPRSSYPEGRVGYLKWRADLKQFHADTSGRILRELGFPAPFITRVQSLNLKKDLGRDPEAQVIEDALCLMTLQYQLTDLCQKTPREKMITILQKTWRKMSPAGHTSALALPYPAEQLALIKEALSA